MLQRFGKSTESRDNEFENCLHNFSDQQVAMTLFMLEMHASNLCGFCFAMIKNLKKLKCWYNRNVTTCETNHFFINTCSTKQLESESSAMNS